MNRHPSGRPIHRPHTVGRPLYRTPREGFETWRLNERKPTDATDRLPPHQFRCGDRVCQVNGEWAR